MPGSATVAFDHPFAETADHWIPIGLSDPDGPENGGTATSLDIAMKTAVRHAMAFLTEGVGLAGPVAYAYLSAASDFQCSQVVDRRRASTRRSGRPTSPDPGCGWS